MRRLNADTMKLHISALDHDRKLKFSSYVYLPSINQNQECDASVIFCNEHELNISLWIVLRS